MSNKRCPWTGDDIELIKYHDGEWGVPVHNDQPLFEMLALAMFQAGLSCHTVLPKREAFQKAFDHFNVKKVAAYPDAKIQSLLEDPAIIRNHLKIRGTVINAGLVLIIQKEFGSFDKYAWSFTHGKTIVNAWKDHGELPSNTRESDAMSADMHTRGFKFAGSTICYAFMQSVGMVNDHLVSCPWHKKVR